ncbi:ATP-dependent DNA ligase [Patescibacteria group bacterium]
MTFEKLSFYIQKIENTSSRLEMTEYLSELFKKASGDEIGNICYLLLGRVAPLFDGVEFGMADKFMIRAIAISLGIDQPRVLKEFKKKGDMGIVVESLKSQNLNSNKSAFVLRQAQELRRGKQNSKRNTNVNEVFDELYEIAKISGFGSQDKKITRMAEIINSVSPLSARYLVRIPLDKLRLGFSDMTILDSLSWMITGDKSLRVKLEVAYSVRPDIGFIASQVKKDGIESLSGVKAKLGVPILASLCQRIPTADEMIKKMVRVAVEPKFDGVRVQIHFKKVHSSQFIVHSFSRNLENTTGMFPELDEISKQVEASEVILDSEAVGIDPKTGKIIPFQETATRKRKHNIDLFTTSVPIKFFVFDILYVDGKDLISKPLEDRRDILEKTIKKGKILEMSPQIITDKPNKLRKYHEDQIKKGLEGVVVKKWTSPYTPGRRNYSWVKFKEEGRVGKLTDTIDGVVMGYYLGEGKRSGFGIGALLVGIRNEDNIVTVSKIGTGVSDNMWKDFKIKLEKLKARSKPKIYEQVQKTLVPDVWCEPKMVIEVAGDDLTKSQVHGSGVAIRFPRLVRIRTDKSLQQITSTEEIKKMYKMQ